MFIGLGQMTLSGGVVRSSGGGGPTDLWPLTGMGAESDWTFSDAGGFWNFFPNFDTLDPTTVELTGAAKTSFDAAVANSTAYSVTVTIVNYGEGSVEISMKGGSFVDMLVNADGDFVQTVTSGTGSGFIIRANGAVVTLGMSDIQITA